MFFFGKETTRDSTEWNYEVWREVLSCQVEEQEKVTNGVRGDRLFVQLGSERSNLIMVTFKWSPVIRNVDDESNMN